MDLLKAFDTLDHTILLTKRNQYGITGPSISWTESYLSARVQHTKVTGVLSNKNSITCGVSQGSILGPLLFLIYTNDLADCFDSHARLIFCADDCTHLSSTNNLIESVSTVIADMERSSCWFKKCKLSLNRTKTRAMIFYPGRQNGPNFCVCINGRDIQIAPHFKILGIIFNSKLTWKHYIDAISTRLSSVIGIIFKCRNCYLTNGYCVCTKCYFCQIWTIAILSGVVLNQLYYIESTCSNTGSSETILGVDRRTSMQDIYFRMKVLTVNQIHEKATHSFDVQMS